MQKRCDGERENDIIQTSSHKKKETILSFCWYANWGMYTNEMKNGRKNRRKEDDSKNWIKMCSLCLRFFLLSSPYFLHRHALLVFVVPLEEGVNVVERWSAGRLLAPALAHQSVELYGTVCRPGQRCRALDSRRRSRWWVERRFRRGWRRWGGSDGRLIALDNAGQQQSFAHRLPRSLLAESSQFPQSYTETPDVAAARPFLLNYASDPSIIPQLDDIYNYLNERRLHESRALCWQQPTYPK